MSALKRWTTLVLLALAMNAMPGCGSGDESAHDADAFVESATEADLVERAVAITLEIEADPDATEQILERNGLTVEEFEEMMLEISKSEDLRGAYNARIGG